MNFAHIALSFLAPMARAFENATKDPMAAQRKVLFGYLRRNRNTEYGRKYGFSGIRSIDDYRKRVPLSDCETIRPYLDRIANGEDDILVSDKVVFFGTTSGTTDKPKLIPSTRYSESKKARLTGLWAYYISRDHPNASKGKVLAIVSPETVGRTDGGIPYGAETGYGYRRLPITVRRIYCLPHAVFEITDYDSRYYAILRIAMSHNVTDVATLNPNTLILLCQKIGKWQDEIISDIENGTLTSRLIIDAGVRSKIEKTLSPKPGRAKELRRTLEEKGELLPKYFWPDLCIIECWKGSTMRLYLGELVRYFGNVPTRDMGCLSTEARSSISMSDEGAGGVLAIETNFYEFIPKDEIDKPDKKTLLCDGLEKGKEYFIVVTTPGGLYRYNIDDIVRVDGFFNRTPVIEFVQKGMAATSLAGEKLYESQLNEAVNIAAGKLKLFIEFFCAVAKTTTPPRYEFLTEFSGSVGRDQKMAFLRALEEELLRQNQEYLYWREAQGLGPPVLKVVKSCEFEKYRQKRLSQGALEGQFKLPELTLDQDFEKNFHIEEEICL
jgi:hypothetical protein